MASKRKIAKKLDSIISQLPKEVRDSVDEEGVVENVLRKYGCHLVSLIALRQPLDEHGQPKGKMLPFFASGTVMQINGDWWWVTAGHNIDQIHKTVRQEKYTGFGLVDHYGTGSDRQNYIPFDYDDADIIHEYDENNGVDYALIKLPKHIVRLLKANNVKAVTKKEWNANPLPFDFFFMMGLSKDHHEYSTTDNRQGYVVRTNAKPSVIYIEKIEKPKKEWQQSKYPRFIGKVGSKFNIEGMSGGPIFGLVLDTLEFRVVAIQSSWLKTKRISFGFPLRTIGKLAEKTLKGRATKAAKRQATKGKKRKKKR